MRYSCLMLFSCPYFEALAVSINLDATYCRTEERAAGWYRLTREILKLPEAPSLKETSKDKAQKTRRPQPLIKLVMRRLIALLCVCVCVCVSWMLQ